MPLTWLESVTKARTQLSLEVIVLTAIVKLHETTIEKHKKELRGSRNLLKDTQHEIENQLVEIHNQNRSLESHKAQISKLQKAAVENVKKLSAIDFYRIKEKKWMADNSKLKKELMTERECTKDAKHENEMQNQKIQELEKKINAGNKEFTNSVTKYVNEIFIKKETIKRLQVEQTQLFEKRTIGSGSNRKANENEKADFHKRFEESARKIKAMEDDVEILFSLMNQIVGDTKHANDGNTKPRKRQLCSEEVDRNINLVECQRQQGTQSSRESTNEEKSEDLLTVEDTVEKNNPIDCKYPPGKRICVDEGSISRDLDETNGLELT
ncbi:unnamed protein product [Orchesella dallaii]|uniref:Uncharacterized protein n=1 Tax=Orchesella dallaii TaxID=48710 RepID=A0ABP1RRT9_9HEXA